jgi:hypothetical protein
MTESPSRQTTQTARGSPQDTAVRTALDDVAGLADVVAKLKAELRTYGEPGVQGRDTQQLLAYFERIHRFEMSIATAMGITWQPGQT